MKDNNKSDNFFTILITLYLFLKRLEGFKMCGFFGVFSNKNFKYDEIITYRKISKKKLNIEGQIILVNIFQKKKTFFQFITDYQS